MPDVKSWEKGKRYINILHFDEALEVLVVEVQYALFAHSKCPNRDRRTYKPTDT